MSDLSRRIGLRGLLFIALAGLGGCAAPEGGLRGLTDKVKPYRMDIVQGNVVTREQLAVLKPGMSRIQVRDVLGSPLLTSVFHADRWDYVFTLRRQGVPSQERRITIFFAGEQVARIEADPLPSVTEFAATLDAGQPRTTRAVSLEAAPEDLQKFRPADKPGENPGTAAGSPATLPPLPASYPPLEPVAAPR